MCSGHESFFITVRRFLPYINITITVLSSHETKDSWLITRYTVSDFPSVKMSFCYHCKKLSHTSIIRDICSAISS